MIVNEAVLLHIEGTAFFINSVHFALLTNTSFRDIICSENYALRRVQDGK